MLRRPGAAAWLRSLVGFAFGLPAFWVWGVGVLALKNLGCWALGWGVSSCRVSGFRTLGFRALGVEGFGLCFSLDITQEGMESCAVVLKALLTEQAWAGHRD